MIGIWRGGIKVRIKYLKYCLVLVLAMAEKCTVPSREGSEVPLAVFDPLQAIWNKKCQKITWEAICIYRVNKGKAIW